MEAAVLISTYNQPASLRKCLLGFLAQTERRFQCIVADDGSTAETALLLQRAEFAPLRIRHLWQKDIGWRRPRVLNLALAQIDADYCIFIDGDCIPRADFVESHLAHRRPGHYISAGRIPVKGWMHAEFTDGDILSNRVFDVDFLTGIRPTMWQYRFRLRDSRWKPLLNYLTFRPRVFHGSNASAWREDILAINGFDETFGYGSDDREFGVRLGNAGVRSRWLKFSLIQLHLNHPTNPNRGQISKNRRRFQKLFFTGQSWVPNGIDTVLDRERLERAA